MKVLNDFRGLAIRLTGERLAHILEHPEMAEMEAAIALHPERVVQSLYRPGGPPRLPLLRRQRVGNKYLCVIVKAKQGDALVLTPYLTDRIKRGVQLWPNES